MPLMPCSEDYCDNMVSTTAIFCPKCGTRTKKILGKDLTNNYIAIPINPIEYWFNWHFFYFWGGPFSTVKSMKIANIGWINKEDALIEKHDIIITSPYSGNIISSKHTFNESIDVNYFFPSKDFIILNPLKTHFPNEEGSNGELQTVPSEIFDTLIEKIYDAEFSDNILRFLFNKSIQQRSKFDIKMKFKSSSDLIEAARNLRELKFLWIDRTSIS